MLRDRLWNQLSSVDLLRMTENVPPEMDLVMSGGGFLGYYLVGVDRVLRKLQQEGKLLKVVRYAGTSVGALASVAMVCNLGDHMIALYDNLQGTPDFFPKIRDYFISILPPDAYEQCTGRVHIVISRLEFLGGFLPHLKPMVVSSFENNHDLVEACMASCSVPYFVSSHLFYPYRGFLCMDGFFTKNVHIFEDSTRPQLVVRLHHIPYSWKSVLRPQENVVLPLIIQGAMETELFFHQSDARVGALEWHSFSSKKVKAGRRRVVPMILHKLRHGMWNLSTYGPTLRTTSVVAGFAVVVWAVIVQKRRRLV
jgi:hypothetical protein